MRTCSPSALAVGEALDLMPIQNVLGLVREHCDSAWLARCLGGMVVPTDEGVYWCALPGDLEIWPVRVLVYQWDGERHAVWLTYQWPDGAEVVVATQEGPPVLQVHQAGEAGRLAMLEGGGEVAGMATP